MIKNIIGLGNAGCSVIKEFEKYSEYKIFKLNTKFDTKKNNYFKLIEYETPEEYENNPPDLKSFFKPIKSNEEILFIVCGSEIISSCSLVILEQLKHCKISILYIKPEETFLGKIEKLQENLCFNVFQQFARSGLIKRLYIVSNIVIEEILGGVPVIGYFEKINKALFSVFHMINKIKDINPVFSCLSELPEATRISTIGWTEIETGVDKAFFPLDNVSDIQYCYFCNEDFLKSNLDFFRKIKKELSDKKNISEKRISYSVYATNFEENYGYILLHTSVPTS